MRLKKLIMIVLSLCPCMGFALEFSDIKLFSYLNEPLEAELELLGTESLSPEQIQVTLASEQEFKRLGLERQEILSQINFEVSRVSERTFVHIRSVAPVALPFVECLLRITAADKSILHGYTFLLDPAPLNAPPLPDRRSHIINSIATIDTSEKLFIENDRDNSLAKDLPTMTIVATLLPSEKVEVKPKPTEVAPKLQEKSVAVLSKPAKAQVRKNNSSNVSQGLFGVLLGFASLGSLGLFLYLLKRRIFKHKTFNNFNDFNNDDNNTQNALKIPAPATPELRNFSILVRDEMHMKLELAERYCTLGDVENARALLEDVIQAGNEETKVKAQALLDKISTPAETVEASLSAQP